MDKGLIQSIVDGVDGAELGTSAEVKMWLPTGNYALNKVISGSYKRGVPFGRVIDIFGDPSTGKSLLIYHMIAHIQKMGGVAILDDTEDAYTKSFGECIGIDNDSLIRLSSLTVEEHFGKCFLGWKQPSSGKDKLPLVQLILDEDPNCPILVALDSLALLSTDHERDSPMETPDMSKAKMIRKGLRKSSDIMSKGNIIHVISNHVTAKIGVMFGKKTTTPGGSGVPFQASVRLELSSAGKVKDDDKNVTSVKSGVHVSKNKIGMPFKNTEIEIFFDRGMDPYSGLLESLELEGIVKPGEKRGEMLYGDKSFRKSEFLEFIQANPDLLV